MQSFTGLDHSAFDFNIVGRALLNISPQRIRMYSFVDQSFSYANLKFSKLNLTDNFLFVKYFFKKFNSLLKKELSFNQQFKFSPLDLKKDILCNEPWKVSHYKDGKKIDVYPDLPVVWTGDLFNLLLDDGENSRSFVSNLSICFKDSVFYFKLKETIRVGCRLNTSPAQFEFRSVVDHKE
jgi:hypothetical protein